MQNGEVIRKNKTKVIVRYDNKLIAHIAVKLDNWVVLQKWNPSFHGESDWTTDPVRETKSV